MDRMILDLDATQLSIKIKAGEITSSFATKTYIEHIKKVNTKLNCLVEDRFEQALTEAEQCDLQLKEGRANGRVFGVPISMKECFDVSGMKTTGGLLHLKDRVKTSDADIVTKLKAEGAIILGKTNTPTLCFCQETENKLYGRTNNPWDVNRTVGGSSGGEGALIAVGGAAVGVGSDIGGSIRFPAHFNGVIGFKSGKQQVSQTGHFPFVEEPTQQRMLGVGALAKSVHDTQLIHEIIASQPILEVDISTFQFLIPPLPPEFPVNQSTKQLLEKVNNFLASQSPVNSLSIPLFEKMALIWQLVMSIDGGESVGKIAFGERTVRPIREYLREILTKKADIHSYLTWALIGVKLFQPKMKQVQEIKEFLAKVDHQYNIILQNQILVLPVYHSAAKLHGDVYRELFSVKKTYLRYMPYISVANVLGLPALVIPVGTDENGLPIAIQLLSAVGNERALFHFGNVVEKEFRGYQRCKTYDA